MRLSPAQSLYVAPKVVDSILPIEKPAEVKSSPKWSPGKLRGMTVLVSFIIMLDFKLN